MSNDNVAPINHSAGSAAATTLSSTAGGAVKTGAKWWAITAGVGGAIGLVAGLALTGVITIPVGLFTAFSGMGLLKVGVIAATTIGGLVGAATFLGPAAGTIGAAVGAGKGAIRGANKVSEERGQAAQLQAQVEVAKAQATAYNPYAAQGSSMNPAGTQINVGRDMQYDGVVNGPQLAMAR